MNSNDKLFCFACKDDLGGVDRGSSVESHLVSKKHFRAKIRMEKTKQQEIDIAKFLTKTNGTTEVSDVAKETYQLRVTEALLRSGIPFETLGHDEQHATDFRFILEGNGYRLGTEGFMSDQVQKVRQRHEDMLGKLFKDKPTSHIFDGSCLSAQSLCLVSRVVVHHVEAEGQNYFEIVQKLVDLSLIEASPTGPTTAGYITKILNKYNMLFENVSALICDRCYVNNNAVSNLRDLGLFPACTHLPCFSHSLNLVGKKVKTPMLNAYLKSLNIGMGQSKREKTRVVNSLRVSCGLKKRLSISFDL